MRPIVLRPKHSSVQQFNSSPLQTRRDRDVVCEALMVQYGFGAPTAICECAKKGILEATLRNTYSTVLAARYQSASLRCQSSVGFRVGAPAAGKLPFLG